MTPDEIEVEEFLRESNAIEGVYDTQSAIDAHLAWDYVMTQDVLTSDVVRETHRILMQNQPLYEKDKGAFRTCSVRVGGRVCLDYTLVPQAMFGWCMETMRAEPPVHPVALHVEYEKIHPFVDGNGRTGRIFLNWTRLRRTNEPLIIIKAAKSAEYYKLFR